MEREKIPPLSEIARQLQVHHDQFIKNNHASKDSIAKSLKTAILFVQTALKTAETPEKALNNEELDLKKIKPQLDEKNAINAELKFK
ncbi:hypothetical protein HY994_05605 [Candidatus Micrarchaeota archaeon]|nr:hypothetical protein [Candidatus Micrarchaeota archaeon]